DRTAVIDLRPAIGHWSAVDEFNQHGNVAGLDDVEDILACPVHDGRDNTETDGTAPEGRGGLEPRITEGTNAEANAGAGTRDQDIGERDAEIDGKAQQDERHGLNHHPERAADAEIPHAFPRIRKTDGSWL